jgi:DNA-binding Xre family transcriptional regulator
MSKSELAEKAKLSRSTLHQLTQNQSVTLDTVLRICQALDCDLIDVVEMKHEAQETLSADGRIAD